MRISAPNANLQPNWYKGLLKIDSLGITKFSSITANSFNSPALRSVERLSLSIPKFIEPIPYERGIFNGLTSLSELYISDITFTSIDKYFLQPLQKSLRYFSSDVFPKNPGDLNQLFGGARMSRLEYIRIMQYDFYPMHVIAGSNFTGLPAIQHLELAYCGIEVILADTFNFIGETLVTLHLEQNRLTTVQFSTFRQFLEKWPRFGYTSKVLNLYDCELECDCEFYKLRNITVIAMGHLVLNGSCTATRNYNMYSTECFDDFQVIHTNRLHLRRRKYTSYAYFKFELRMLIDNTTLIISNPLEQPFQLLILTSNGQPSKPKCPNRYWLQHWMPCWRLSNPVERIPVKRYLHQSTVTLFCVTSLLSQDGIWPLHCISFRTEEKGTNPLVVKLIAVTIVIVVALILGFSLTILVYRTVQSYKEQVRGAEVA